MGAVIVTRVCIFTVLIRGENKCLQIVIVVESKVDDDAISMCDVCGCDGLCPDCLPHEFHEVKWKDRTLRAEQKRHEIDWANDEMVVKACWPDARLCPDNLGRNVIIVGESGFIRFLSGDGIRSEAEAWRLARQNPTVQTFECQHRLDGKEEE